MGEREREKEWDEWTSLRWAQGQGKWSNDIDGVGVEVEEGRDVNGRADVNAQCMCVSVWVIRRALQCVCVCVSLYSGSAVSTARVSIFITLFQGLRVEETIKSVLNEVVDKTNKFLFY